MAHTFLHGYHIEVSESTQPGVIETFLRAAGQLHREMQVPCTLFVRGRVLEQHTDEFRRLRDECGHLLDLQQYTYSGLPLKTVCQENHQGVKLFRGGSPEACRVDVARASDLMESILGVRPIGLAGPLGYYRGLCDRPDMLEILSQLGIRFTRAYTRNARDWSPVSFEMQPFRYEAQGFPDMLEIPGQGWSDSLLREALGGGERERYIGHIRKDLDYVAAKELTWSFVQQGGPPVLGDPQMSASRAILEHARTLGFRMLTHRAYCEERMSPQKVPTAGDADTP